MGTKIGPATLAAATLAMQLACSSEGGPAATSGDAGIESGARGVDPFCRTRPRLTFCEDFDEAELPGRFARIEGAAAIVTREAHADAPSAPSVITIAHAPGSTDARLVLPATEGVKYNLFFFVSIQPVHGRVALAGFDDGAWHLEIGLEADGKWYVEEQPGAVPDGGPPVPRTIATQVAPKIGAFASVRFDVYVDGNGLGHMRFRSGGDTVFESEALTFGGGKATITPQIYVGARLRSGALSRLSFDSVTLGED
jgi:hypothetical protein